MESLEERYFFIQEELKAYSQAKLIAVSKYTPDKNIHKLYEMEQRDFGESRIPSLQERSVKLPKEIRWHFIGNLQSNKIKKLLQVKGLYAIHSVDRISILEKLLNSKCEQRIDLYLQVKTAEEKEKSGFETYEDLSNAIELFKKSEHSNFVLKGTYDDGRNSDRELFRKCTIMLRKTNRLSKEYENYPP